MGTNEHWNRGTTREAVKAALEAVCRHFEEEHYAAQNVRVRMRGAHLLAMRLLGVPWPAKGEPIQPDWWKSDRG